MKRILLAAVLLAMPAWPALMSDSVPEPDSLFLLKEVLVVATRLPDRLADITLSTSVVSRPTLVRQLRNDALVVLQDQAGIDARGYFQDHGLSSIGIWGSSTQQVLTLVDGHPLTNPVSGLTDLGLVSLSGAEAVEIARGAGSSIYGANALGGVVNFVTATPENLRPDALFADIRADGGMPWADNVAIRLGDRVDKLGAIAGIEHDWARGLRSNSRSETQASHLTVGFYPSRNQSIDMTAGLNSRDIGLPGPKPDPSAIPQYGDSSASSRYDVENDAGWSARGNWHGRWSLPGNGPKVRAELKPDYSYLHTLYKTLSPYALSPDSATRDDYFSRSGGNALLVSGDFRSGLRAVLGYDNRFDFVNVASQTDTSWRASSATHGVWGEATVPILDMMLANGSLRWDINRDFGQALNPSLGIAAQLNNSLKLRANWGTAFRAPSVSDRYWPRSGVRNLRPERGWTAQTGIDFRLAQVSISATGFLRRTRDLISWIPDTGGLWRPTNVDSSSHLGAEVSAEFQPVRGLTLSGSATYLKAEQVRREMVFYDWMTGETRFEFRKRVAAFEPEFSARAGASYRFAFGLEAGINARLKSIRYNYYPNWDRAPDIGMDTKSLPSYLVFDARLEYEFLRNWRAGLQFDNITGERYSEQFGNSIRDLDYPSPGRTVMLGLRYRLD